MFEGALKGGGDEGAESSWRAGAGDEERWKGLGGEQVVHADGDPAIRVTQVQDWLSINPQFVEAGEIEQIAQRLTEVLRR